MNRTLTTISLRYVMPLFVAVVLTGCQSIPSALRQEPAKDERTITLCLVDISGSTHDPKIRQHYENILKQVIGGAPAGSTLWIGPILSNAWSPENEPIQVRLPAEPTLMEGKQFETRQQMQLMRLQTLAKAKALIHADHTPKSTDIFGALGLAEKILQGPDFRDYPHRQLVLVSDMVEQGQTVDLYSENLSEARIPHLLDQFDRQGMMPNLKGVTVWMAGAGVVSGTPLPPARALSIQRFWMAWFQAAGADVDTTRYGGILLNFP